MNDTGKVMVALLAGVATGVVMGMLLAPEKGSETRDKIGDALSDLTDAVKERAEEQLDKLNGLKEKLVATVKSKIGEVQHAVVSDEVEEHG